MLPARDMIAGVYYLYTHNISTSSNFMYPAVCPMTTEMLHNTAQYMKNQQCMKFHVYLCDKMQFGRCPLAYLSSNGKDCWMPLVTKSKVCSNSKIFVSGTTKITVTSVG